MPNTVEEISFFKLSGNTVIALTGMLLDSSSDMIYKSSCHNCAITQLSGVVSLC